MYLISGNITSNVTGNLPVITGNGNIGNITSNFRTLIEIIKKFNQFFTKLIYTFGITKWRSSLQSQTD